MKKILVAMLLLGSAAISAQAQSNLGWLSNTPAEKFTKTDMKLLAKAVHDALENSPDGTPVTWENAAAQNGGTITPSKDPAGRPDCRKARIENHHKGLDNTNDVVFCKVDGKWKWDRK